MIRAAIIGCGNIGKGVFEAINAAPDFTLAGIVKRNESSKIPKELMKENIVTNIAELEKTGKIDVAILCLPSRSIPDAAPIYLERGINTIDGYDIHTDLWEVRVKLDECAKKNKAVAVLGTGWDPGSDSVIRAIFECIAPWGKTYTNFGPGMSMGHTVAVKAVKGVKNAMSVTIPKGQGLHRRMVYIEVEDGYDFDKIAETIKNDAYFVHDETYVNREKDVTSLIDVGHASNLIRKGVSGIAHNQIMEYTIKANNPALTAQVMISSARAAMKQKPGCYTMIEIPAIDYLYGEKEDLIRRIV